MPLHGERPAVRDLAINRDHSSTAIARRGCFGPTPKGMREVSTIAETEHFRDIFGAQIRVPKAGFRAVTTNVIDDLGIRCCLCLQPTVKGSHRDRELPRNAIHTWGCHFQD
jgi:hypothetical protein